MNVYNNLFKQPDPQPVPQILLDEESLIRLKGIDAKRDELLNKQDIDSAFELLQRCATTDKRSELAEKLFKLEKSDCHSNLGKWKIVYAKEVDSWVKQANLLRIKGMDADTAYMLVQLGIRDEKDLAKVDVDKVYKLLAAVANSQPNFSLMPLNSLIACVEAAGQLTNYYLIGSRKSSIIKQLPSQRVLRELILKKYQGQLNTDQVYQLLVELQKQQAGKNLTSSVVYISISTKDPEPAFLFRQEATPVTYAKVIPTGLGYLKDVEEKLPLPSTIEGYVLLIPSNAPAGSEDKQPLRNAEVTLSGIFGPNMDKEKKDSGPSTYTDSTGKFILHMPDLYNLQEAVTLTFSQGINKQEFLLSATDILEHVAKAKVLNAFQNWYRVCGKLEKLENETDTAASTLEYQQLLARKNELAEFIRNSSEDKNQDFEIIYERLFSLNNLKADFTQEPFILHEDIFKNKEQKYTSVLPQVKLLENNDQPIYLPTDTAPSQIFNYSMLQRLVEPAIGKEVTDKTKPKNNVLSRSKVTDSIDVGAFKKAISLHPNTWSQMSSLGIGYILNMHQAWVPDGFALGNLLYSLVLAPGEEQRLIVRENKQSFTLQDTAEGSESVSEDYRNNQLDNTTAAYDYALQQMSLGNSSSKYQTHADTFGGHGGFAGFGAVFGLSGSTSNTSGSASSSASQRNSHNEASNAAQKFQHGIKTASDRISQAQRLSISLATSEQSDSVATRLIANHNHSHAMTIQYWEVMRRYSLETCIEGVDLVLYVPLKLIKFAYGEDSALEQASKEGLTQRYATLLSYADDLLPALPGKYRTGLRLIQKYLTSPNWTVESSSSTGQSIIIKFKGSFFNFDQVEATLYLKNGKGAIAGTPTIKRKAPGIKYERSYDVKENIRYQRCHDPQDCSVTFNLPSTVSAADLSHIELEHTLNTFKYELFKNPNAKGMDGVNVLDIIKHMTGKMYDLAKDHQDSDNDRKKIAYDQQMLPEAWSEPHVVLTPRDLRELGEPLITNVTTESKLGQVQISATASSSSFNPSIRIYLATDTQVATADEVQEMEQTYQHIIANTMTYSQVVWASLTADERALLLEQYSVDMDFSKATETEKKKDEITIPLLNCIDVKKLIGFYGNCMLFPFTYPKELADKIGKTAGELQDALYRYHANYFRVPATSISLPTDGMIGEAVLSQTNVSEKIDLTRFWNWKDSPIDKMPIDNNYLNATDYLANKTTKDIAAMNLAGVNPTAAVTSADLISALVNKPTPKFDNITGLDNLEKILNSATTSASTGRDSALKHSADTTKAIADYAYKLTDLYMKYKKDEKKDEAAEGQEAKPAAGGAGAEAGKGGAGGKGTSAGGAGTAAGGLTAAIPEIVKAAIQAIAKKETVETFVGKYVNKGYDLDEIKLIYDVTSNVVKAQAAKKE